MADWRPGVCEAGAQWNNENLVVAAEASQVDVDAFGVELARGAGVAFQ